MKNFDNIKMHGTTRGGGGGRLFAVYFDIQNTQTRRRNHADVGSVIAGGRPADGHCPVSLRYAVVAVCTTWRIIKKIRASEVEGSFHILVEIM